LKLKLAGIHDSADLMAFFEDRTIVEASALFKTQLNGAEQTGLDSFQAIRVFVGIFY
jgi:hypothetical protein